MPVCMTAEKTKGTLRRSREAVTSGNKREFAHTFFVTPAAAVSRPRERSSSSETGTNDRDRVCDAIRQLSTESG